LAPKIVDLHARGDAAPAILGAPDGTPHLSFNVVSRLANLGKSWDGSYLQISGLFAGRGMHASAYDRIVGPRIGCFSYYRSRKNLAILGHGRAKEALRLGRVEASESAKKINGITPDVKSKSLTVSYLRLATRGQ